MMIALTVDITPDDQRGMIRIIQAALSLFLILSSSQAGALEHPPGWPQTLNVGYFVLEPHAFEPPKAGEHRGMAITYFNEIASCLGTRAEWQRLPFSRLLYSLERNHIQVALFLAANEDRRARFQYPAEPFFNMRSAIAVRGDQPLHSITNIDDLIPLRIGFFHEGFRSPLMMDDRLKFTMMTGSNNVFESLVRQLIAKRIDAIYNPTGLSLEHQINSMQLNHVIRMLPLPEPPTGLYTVFSQQVSKSWIEAYNKQNHSRSLAFKYQSAISNNRFSPSACAS